jgi:hypothetical protein
MYKSSIKYGAASGIIIGLISVATFYAGYPTRGNKYLTIASLFFLYIPSLLTIYNVRKSNGGEISFMNSLKVGILSGWITSLIFIIFTYMYYNYLNPNFAYKYLVDIEISLKQSGLTGAELKKEMADWKVFFSPNSLTLNTLFRTILTTTIMAAINALILFKKD